MILLQRRKGKNVSSSLRTERNLGFLSEGVLRKEEEGRWNHGLWKVLQALDLCGEGEKEYFEEKRRAQEV